MNEENLVQFHNSVKLELNRYYFDRLWKSYGVVLMLLCIDMMLIFVTKSQETRFIVNLDRIIEGLSSEQRRLDHVPEWWVNNEDV